MRFALPWSRSRPAPTTAEPTVSPLPPRAPGVLREMTAEDRVGEMEIRPEDPAMHVAEEVCFVPDGPGGRWGVFDAEGQPIAESLDYNGSWSEPMWPRPVCPVRPAEVTAALPDDEYLYLGFIHLHFGHFLIDSLSRAWPLIEAGARRPKLLYHGWEDPDYWWREVPWLAELLTGLGLAKRDLIRPAEPVRIKRLLVPGRSFQGQFFAHQSHQRVCRKIGAAMLEGVDVARGGGPIYLSKTRLKGGVRKVDNEHQLEGFLRPRGVEIIIRRR